MSYDPARSGAKGNTRLLKQYGGGSDGPRQSYATGGAVTGGSGPKAYASGGMVEGGMAKPRLDKPSRSKAKAGKKGTNVNVIVMPKDGGGDKAPPMPMPPMGGPPPGPPMPPPGAGPGGPPMPPMRANGGRVGYKIGGKVKKRADGGRADISKDSLKYAREQRAEADSHGNTRNLHTGIGTLTGVASLLPGSGKVLRGLNIAGTASQATSAMSAQSARNKALNRADRAERGLVAEGEEDKKNGGKVCRAEGGRVHMDAGAGSGEGRLEKCKDYGK